LHLFAALRPALEPKSARGWDTRGHGGIREVTEVGYQRSRKWDTRGHGSGIPEVMEVGYQRSRKWDTGGTAIVFKNRAVDLL